MKDAWRTEILAKSEHETILLDGSEVFSDVGVLREDNVLVGERDGAFSFLDVGSDGEVNTNDLGEGNGVHDAGEPSEPFSDVNGNGRHD